MLVGGCQLELEFLPAPTLFEHFRELVVQFLEAVLSPQLVRYLCNFEYARTTLPGLLFFISYDKIELES